MSRGKWAVLVAVLVWALVAGMEPACFGGRKAAAPAVPDISALARRARPAVGVLVTFDASGKPLSQGTAFFVGATGVGITCHHVLEGATSALVRMENGAIFQVEGALAADPVRDVALFKVAGKSLPTVPLGDSSALRPGQRVVAIAAPEGLGNTVADGPVERGAGAVLGLHGADQRSAVSGVLGGPIFDLSGKVVAVAAAVLTEGQALNFAIPINAAKPLLARPGRLTPLAPAKQPADLDDWLRQRPHSTLGPPTAAQVAAAKKQGKVKVKIETTKGAIEVELDGNAAPLTVADFLNLVKAGFYNGIPFHRVEPGFVIQAGDPTAVGRPPVGFTIPDEKSLVKHTKGTIAMARAYRGGLMVPNSGNTQFYITLADTPHLDVIGFTAFGKVVSGMDVVEKIVAGDRIVKASVVSHYSLDI